MRQFPIPSWIYCAFFEQMDDGLNVRQTCCADFAYFRRGQGGTQVPHLTCFALLAKPSGCVTVARLNEATAGWSPGKAGRPGPNPPRRAIALGAFAGGLGRAASGRHTGPTGTG